MQIRFKNYFFNNKIGIEKLLGTFLFLILTQPLIIGSTFNSPAERAEIIEGVLYFSSVNPTLNSEFNSNIILSGDPPIANLDTVNVLQGTSVSGNVLLNDIDPDGDVLILNTTPVVAPSNGTVTLNTDGTFTYLPYPFFVGTDQFTYEVCDGGLVDITDSYDNQTNVTITPFGTPTVSSTITVSSGGTITDVNIPNFFLEHTWDQDLIITLTSPSGTVVTLVDQVCEDENFDIGFDDESGVAYGSMPCPPDEGGMNQPFETLSAFDGENSVGDWVLTIYDVAFYDGGFLDFWELDITSLGAAAETNCVTATVTALVYSSSTEICSNNIDDDGDGLVDVFDPDCPCDDGNFLGLCDPQCEYTPPGTPNFDIEVEWASEDSVNTFTPVIGADLDGDISSVEILGFKESTTTYVENALFIIDGATGLTKYNFNSKPLHVFNKGLAFGDVDKDGNGEIYYMIGNGDVDDYRRIACYEYNPAGTNLGGTGTGSFDLQWVSDQRVTCGLAYPLYTVTDNYAVNLADFNNDGFPEVYVGNEIFDAITGTRLAMGGANNIGNNIYDFYLHEHFHANTVAVDALPDGDCTNCNGLELVAGNQVYSVNLTTGVMTVERELTTAPGYQDGPVSIADYDLDGDVDGIITTTDEDGSYLYVWDLQTETMIGNAHTIADADISTIWYRSASNATIADFDGDNKPEIGVCANFVFQVIEDYQFDISGTGGVAWSLVTTDRSGMTGATSFDFNADGLTEVVYRDEDNLRIISGASGINLSTFPCGSRTGGEYPIVLDIDNDSETELVCTCADETYARNGRMRAFKSQDYPWVPTRNIWNQYAYFITNVNDDLSIPPVQQPHHLVGSPALGATGRLNSFLKQVGPYNNEGEPVFPAADIFVNIIDGGPTGCVLGDSIAINLRFYNLGDLSYPAGIPFSVYDGNPENTGTLVETFDIPTSIIPGDSVDVSITLAVAGLTTPFNIFVIGNDDGSLVLPLDLENDFPATSIGECDFSNNMDSILVSNCETEAPVLVGVPNDITIECDETVSVPTVTATDNCSTGMTVDYSFDENLGTCTGTIIRTWTVTDDCGNVATETQTITVQDSEAPFLWGVPSNTTFDCNSQYPGIPNVTATDDCSGVMSITYDTLLVGGSCPYTITRTWTATDSCNNSISQSYTLSVLDDEFPVFTGVPSNVTVECTELPDPADVTVTDNCDNNIDLIYEDVYLPNGNYENNDETTVPASGFVWNIDVSGYAGLDASDFLSFDLSFQSNKGKGRAEFVLINPSGQGIFLIGEHCTTGDCEGTGGTLVWSPTFYRCDTGNPQWNNDDPIPPSAGNFIPHGTTPIDPVPGVIEYVTCFEDFTGPMDGQWQLYARKNQTANGLLKFQGFSFNLGNHSCLDEGTIFRTWTATDDCGNMTTASQTITLEDTTPPVINVPDDVTVECDNIPDIPTLTADDCISGLSVVFLDEVSTGGCPYTITRRWTAEDVCGNIDTATHVITVEDSTPPVIDAPPADFSISCDLTIPDPVELFATDNCTEDIEVDYNEVIGTGCPFTITRTWTATDDCDNETTVTQIVTIIDTSIPTFNNIPSNVTIECDEMPTDEIVTASDNCDTNVDVIFSEETTTGCPYSIIRKWYATDDCGNIDSIQQVITIDDTVAPTIIGIPADVTFNCTDPLAAPDFSCDSFVENVALGKSTSQKNTSSGGVSSRAVDGDTNGNWGGGSITHTSNTYEPWWEVDLEQVETIDSIVLWNRTNCCSGRLSNVYVLVSDNPFTSTDLATTIAQSGVSNFYYDPTVNISETFNINATGRYVRVQLDKTGILSLAEAQIFATKVADDGICATDNCDNDVTVVFDEVSTQTTTGDCSDNNYTITRTWTATDDCGNETIETQIITIQCECCDNGIDDDGDGLIDGVDSECACLEIETPDCDSLLYYHLPPVWQMDGGAYNNPSELIITTLYPNANVNIQTADGSSFNQNISVANGAETIVTLNSDILQTPNENSEEEEVGLIIESDFPIQVTYRVNSFFNKLMYTAKGEQALGRSFRAGSQTKTCGSPNTSINENHFISVMATEDNTTVYFSFSQNLAGGITTPHSVSLDAGQTYLVRDDNDNSTVSGALITADKPIAVVSGSQNTNICNSSNADGGADQLIPTCDIGTDYVAIRGEGGDDQNYIVIVPNEDNTEIYIDGNPTPVGIAQAGGYFEYDMSGSFGDAHYIQTSKPAYVYHFTGMSSVEPEVGMAVLPPVAGCLGDKKIEFAQLSGGETHAAYVIIDDASLANLTLNGNAYSLVGTTSAVPGFAGYSVVLFQHGVIGNYNIVESDGYFQMALISGIQNISGSYTFLSSFKEEIKIYEPELDLPTTYYFVDSLCAGTVLNHCLNVETCSGTNTITNIATSPNTGSVSVTSDLCFDYTPATNFTGTDVITVTVENGEGLVQEVCLEFYICSGGSLTLVGNTQDTITITCNEAIPAPPVPVVSDGCMIVEFEENITSEGGECANNSYTVERVWRTFSFCGSDSLAFTQVVNIVDNTPPIITNVPADVEINCVDCLQSFVNGDFEENIEISCWNYKNMNDVNGWSTTASSSAIEIQKSGCVNGTDSYEGDYHAELNSNTNGDFYQEFCTVPTTTLQISFAHHKRMSGGNSSDDIMAVYAGSDLNNLTWLGTFNASDTSEWTVHTVDYQIPSGQDNSVFLFRAIQGAPGNITLGNLIDAVNVVTLFDPVQIPDATDVCDDDVELEVSEVRVDGGCENHFTLVRTWTATDNCGNVSTASQTISVGDLEAPTFSFVPNDTTILCTDPLPSYPDITAGDNCSDTTIISLDEVVSTGCPYTITRTWTATDACNNDTIAIQVITVVDTEDPVLANVPENVTVECDAIPSVANVTVSDNCTPNLDIEFTETRTYGCPYFIARVWTATDSCGNETTVSQLITVEDNTDPVLANVPNDVTVDCSSIPAAAIVTASDNCSPNLEVVFTENISTGCPYTITRTWTAMDSCNNTITGTQMITVEDNTDPVLANLPNDITVDCGSIPDTAIVTASDNCSPNLAVVFTENTSTGCPYTITRTWSATDSCNNTITATQIITVNDTTLPVLTGVPNNITVNCDDIIGEALVTALDDCSGNLPVVFNEVVGTGCPYTITRTWTATDLCDNEIVGTQVITLIDTINPVFGNVPTDVTVECDAIPAVATVTASDNCTAAVDVTFSETTTTGCPYTIIRKWIAVDDCQNADSVIQVITVEDTIDPVFANIPGDVTVECDAIPTAASVTASDNCDPNVGVVFSEIIGNGCPYTITRKWLATDNCGNADSVIQVITVEDNTFPVLTGVPNDETVECDAIPAPANVTATDLCLGDVPVLFEEVTNNGCPYTITRTWSAIDLCNNMVIEQQTITVEDNTLPTLLGVPFDITVECNAIPDTAIVTANDNCIPTVEIIFTENISNGCPFIISRTWTAIDSCGNTFSQSQNITVEDNEFPSLIGVPDDVTVNCELIPDPANVTVTDGCWNNLTAVLNEVTSSGCPYTITRIWIATDSCGNSTSATQIVTVEDEEGPVVETPPADITLDCGDPIPPAVELTATDNCSGEEEDGIYIVEDIDFSEEITGECPIVITRTWTAYDECDNESTVSQTITIEDTTAPTVFNIPNDLTLDCGETPDTQMVVATDDCDTDLDMVFEEIYSDTTCQNTFKITRIWTFTDNCGNEISYTQNIQIQDTIAPVFAGVPADMMIPCDSIPEVVTPIATDNCSDVIVTFIEAEIPGDCIDLRLMTRTWTAVDACGNESSVSQNIIFNNCSPDAILTIAPANVVCEGTDVSFEVTLTEGYDTPFYQWQFSTNGITWMDIVGANDSIFTLTAIVSHTGFYQVVVANDPSNINNPLCNITSNSQSLEVIELVVDIENLDLEICQGDSIMVGNSVYFEAGNFVDTLDATSGCDSVIINLNLIVNDIYNVTIDSTICEGESVDIGGNTHSQNGIFVNDLTSTEGCDSIVTLNLTVNPIAQITLDEYICEGQTITIGNTTYDETGTYVSTLLSSTGCDSIVT
ncbi:MAG: Ig-like domain-containing protein [Saprospiraceae bacterium]